MTTPTEPLPLVPLTAEDVEKMQEGDLAIISGDLDESDELKNEIACIAIYTGHDGRGQYLFHPLPGSYTESELSFKYDSLENQYGFVLYKPIHELVESLRSRYQLNAARTRAIAAVNACTDVAALDRVAGVLEAHRGE